jgi:hypothetical protein
MSEIIILTLSPFIACLAYLAVVCWCDCLWYVVVAERMQGIIGISLAQGSLP